MKYNLSNENEHPVLGMFKSTSYGDVTYSKGDEFILPNLEEGSYDVYAIQNDKVIGKREKSGNFILDNKAFGTKLFGLFKKETKLTILAIYRGDSFDKGEGLNYGAKSSLSNKPIKGYDVTLSAYYVFWPLGWDINSLIKNSKANMFNEKFCSIFKNSEKFAKFLRNYTDKAATRLLENEFFDLIKAQAISEISYVGLDEDDCSSATGFGKTLAKQIENDMAEAFGFKVKVSILPSGKAPYGLEENGVLVSTGHCLNSQYYEM